MFVVGLFYGEKMVFLLVPEVGFENPHRRKARRILSPKASNSERPMISGNKLISLTFSLFKEVGKCWVISGFWWYGRYNFKETTRIAWTKKGRAKARPFLWITFTLLFLLFVSFDCLFHEFLKVRAARCQLALGFQVLAFQAGVIRTVCEGLVHHDWPGSVVHRADRTL
jgi:hypothetical protein